MSNIAEITAAQTAGAYQGTQSTSGTNKTDAAAAAGKPGKISKAAYGATIGEPQLSEKAEKYYGELKKKFGNMDFVLVSKDMIDVAKSQASSYGNKNRMVVLIDEEKLEKMATDDKYREKYEGLISTAQEKMPQLQQMMSQYGNIKTVGMQVGNDGRASFFAVMDKSAKDVQTRIEEKRAEKKEAKKAAEKKEAKAKREERLESSRAEKKEAEKAAAEKRAEGTEEEDYDILMASSFEELMRKVEDYSFAQRSNAIETPEEMMVGHTIDFKG